MAAVGRLPLAVASWTPLPKPEPPAPEWNTATDNLRSNPYEFEPEPPAAESFWVIERFEDGKSLGYWFGNSSREFSTDIEIAIQFRRKRDAQIIRRAWHWSDCEVTEHKYVDGGGETK